MVFFCGFFECLERGDVGEGYVSIGFWGFFFYLVVRVGFGFFLGSFFDFGFSDLV